MQRQDVKEFLRELAGANVQLKDSGQWVSTNCPLAPWTHAKGTDSNMSFGVLVNDSGDSVYNCFTCKNRGRLAHLVRQYEEFTGEDFSVLYKEVESSEFLGGSLPDWEKRRTNKKTFQYNPIDDEVLDLYDTAYTHWYVKERNISKTGAEKVDLRVDPDDKDGERILFPVYSPDKKLYGFSSRSVEDDSNLRIKDYFGLPKRHLLLGSHLLDKSDKFAILVEGLFDYAALVDKGFPALAVMHSSLTEPQATLLKNIRKTVYVMFDNDKAGFEGRRQVQKMLGNHLAVMKVKYPEGVKDPAELTAPEVVKMIHTARLTM